MTIMERVCECVCFVSTVWALWGGDSSAAAGQGVWWVVLCVKSLFW